MYIFQNLPHVGYFSTSLSYVFRAFWMRWFCASRSKTFHESVWEKNKIKKSLRVNGSFTSFNLHPKAKRGFFVRLFAPFPSETCLRPPFQPLIKNSLNFQAESAANLTKTGVLNVLFFQNYYLTLTWLCLRLFENGARSLAESSQRNRCQLDLTHLYPSLNFSTICLQF